MIFKKEVWITPYQMNRRLHIYVPQRAMEGRTPLPGALYV